MSTTTTAATPSLQARPARGRSRSPRERTRASASTSARSRSWPTRSPSTACSSRSSSAPTTGGYTLIAGERRYRAAKLAGLTQVPVTLRDGDEDSPIELAVDENLHRQDLDPVEEAHAFQAILSTGKLNKKQLAERVSKSAAYVNDRLRLLDLPDQIQEHVASGIIPVRLAKQLIEIAKVKRAGRDRLRPARRQRRSSRSTSSSSGRSG